MDRGFADALRFVNSPSEFALFLRPESERLGAPLLNPVNLGGLLVGIALMYFTAFFVKF